ncbi:MAG: peptidoglycan-binding domain-containing protein [Chthoniobacteraceae bacterium]
MPEKEPSQPITTWIDCDIIVQAGHQNHLQGWNEGGSGPEGNEIDWTPVIADEAIRILKEAGVRAIKNDASIPAGGIGWNCILAVAVHFDDPDSGESGPSIGYPRGKGNDSAATEFKTLYQKYWPWPELWKEDNFTADEEEYYGYKYWCTTDAEMLIEFGDLGSKRQAEWLKPRLKWLGALLAHFLSKRSGKGGVPEPSPFDNTPIAIAIAASSENVEGGLNLISPSLQGDPTLEAIADGHAELASGPLQLDSVKSIQLALNRLASRQPSYYIDYGPGTKNLGFFGLRTRTAIMAFQSDSGLPITGVVDQPTIHALDNAVAKLQNDPQPDRGTVIPAKIIQIAATSEIAHFDWPGHGVCALGYTKGMALAYGRAYCGLLRNNPFYVEMAKSLVQNEVEDALYRYRDIFTSVGLSLTGPGVDMLRHLYVLVLGLGIRESDGKWNEGIYVPDDNTKHDTAEAGAFQTSFNITYGSKLASDLYQSYRGKLDPWLPVFQEGVPDNLKGLKNWGDGPGVEFQQLSKFNPTFAAEMAALRLRSNCWQWNPIRKYEVTITPKADQMFQLVQNAVDTQQLCPQLT